jgi:hypothetical protein
LRGISSAKQGAMEDRGVAQQKIARAGDQQARRPSMQVREQRREHRIFAVGLSDVLAVGQVLRVDRLHLSRESVQGEELS